jgi:DNA adenine methylase
MILRRLGNKKSIALKVQAHFPAHTLYVEPFFGAGGMFFSKPKAKYNIVNDYDSDVYNLYQVIMTRKDEFVEAWTKLLLHEDLWKHWKKNKETEPIQRACRFLLLSNFSFMGKGSTYLWRSSQNKKQVLDLLDATINFLQDVEFMNTDFRMVLSRLPGRLKESKNYTFCYCDPPYLDTSHNYAKGFTENDSAQLFAALMESGVNWAMSEFDHPFILEQAKAYGCNVHIIGERKNLLNRRVEILVTNY